MSLSGPTRAQAAATAFSQVSVVGTGTTEPSALIVAQFPPRSSHDTAGVDACEASLGLVDGETVATATDVADLAGVGGGAGLAHAASKSATVMTVAALIALCAPLDIAFPVLAFGRIIAPSVYERSRRWPAVLSPERWPRSADRPLSAEATA
jgi:hypothetical protein